MFFNYINLAHIALTFSNIVSAGCVIFVVLETALMVESKWLYRYDGYGENVFNAYGDYGETGIYGGYDIYMNIEY